MMLLLLLLHVATLWFQICSTVCLAIGEEGRDSYVIDIKLLFYGKPQIWVIPPGWGTICDGVNCYIRKCTIYYPWLWLLINIVVISYWRWRDWFHSNLKNNCECALIIKDNRWYIYGCNNIHRHKSCPNLVEWPICITKCEVSDILRLIGLIIDTPWALDMR